jgi:hypothetical protein
MIEKNFSNILDELKFDDVVVLRGKVLSFQGNVVSVDKDNGLFEFYVTHCDDEDALGETIPVNDEIMSVMFHSLEIKRYKKTKEDILSLMDFALAIKDFEWCKEIHKELEQHEKREEFANSRRMVV